MAFSGEWAEARGEWFTAFLEESNRIAGESRQPNEAEMEAALSFLELDEVAIADLARLVEVHAPDAVLRDRSELEVAGGGHEAPLGGPDVTDALDGLLARINRSELTPHDAHCAYEVLQPFTDANGRSGRVLWLWQMERIGDSRHHELGFAHTFYYQSLAETRSKPRAEAPRAAAQPEEAARPLAPPAAEQSTPAAEAPKEAGSGRSAAARRLIERAKRSARRS